MSSSKTLCVSQTFLAGTSSHSNLPFWRALRQWRPMAAAATLWMRCDPHRVFPASPSGPRRRGDPRRPVFTPSDQFGKTGPAETAPGAASARIGRHVCGGGERLPAAPSVCPPKFASALSVTARLRAVWVLYVAHICHSKYRAQLKGGSPVA